jgi:hypothetical protein
MKRIIYIVCVGLLSLACSDEETPQGSFPVPGDILDFESNRGLINDELEGEKIIVIGSSINQYIVSFERKLGDTELEFKPTNKGLPVILEDTEGNSWDIFGFAVSGPRVGQRLKPTHSFMGYWFSFATFYPGIQIFPDADRGEFDGLKIEGTNNWLVPQNEVRSGGVGKDGIPAVSNPKFDDVSNVSYMNKGDLVVGISDGLSVKAYPHFVLDWHEIVNDKMGETDFSIIYCPLTGTASAWDNNINGIKTNFGVSGLLYNTNIVPYDRATNSNWSQLFDAAIFGQLKGVKPKTHMVVETTWATWEKLYPNSKLLNTNTSLNRNYGDYPYGNYRIDESLIFPVKYPDKRLHAKQRVHAVIVNGKARVYRFENFGGN